MGPGGKIPLNCLELFFVCLINTLTCLIVKCDTPESSSIPSKFAFFKIRMFPTFPHNNPLIIGGGHTFLKDFRIKNQGIKKTKYDYIEICLEPFS